jgi:hypothetical protein
MEAVAVVVVPAHSVSCQQPQSVRQQQSLLGPAALLAVEVLLATGQLAQLEKAVFLAHF